MVYDRRPPRLQRPKLEAVFKTNAPDRDRTDLVRFLWRVISFLPQNTRDASSCMSSLASAHMRSSICLYRGKAATAFNL